MPTSFHAAVWQPLSVVAGGFFLLENFPISCITMLVSMKKPQDPLEEFVAPSKEAVAFTEILMRLYERLGKPQDLSTESGWKLMDGIIRVWEKAYPHEVQMWKHDRALDLETERSMKDHLKGGTYNPVTYPPALFHLIKSMFPAIRLSSKEMHHKLVQRYPVFKTTNYNV